MPFLLTDRAAAQSTTAVHHAHRAQETARTEALDPAGLIAMQRLAGNRAATALAVQRCGPIPSGECPCEGNGGGAGAAGASRDSGDATADASGPSADL